MTPYTSYLAEPEMLAAAPAPEHLLQRAMESMPALRAESGQGAVGAGRDIEAMKSLDQASSPAELPRRPRTPAPLEARRTRCAGSRGGPSTFARACGPTPRGRMREKAPAHLLRLSPFGEGYFKLLDAWPGSASVLALGDRVRVMVGAVALEITAEGAADFSGPDWARIRAEIHGRG